MKKDYNRNTMTDMPLDASFPAPINSITPKKTTTKPKINAIGKKANNQSGAKKVSATTKNTSKTQKPTQTKTKVAKSDKKLEDLEKQNEENLKTQKTTKTKTKIAQSSKELEDLEKLNEENLKSFRSGSKRNKVIIVLLSVLLAVAIAVISVYLALSKMETNCTMYVHGASATYIVDGSELEKFRTPQNLQGNRVLKIEIMINIKESGMFNIKFTPECFQNDTLLENTLIYEPNFDLFYEGGDGFYYSKKPIEGDQTIRLCGGVIIDYYYENSLNVDNFSMDFHTYFEKV